MSTLTEPPRIFSSLPKTQLRAYDRAFAWTYLADPTPPPGAGSPSVPVTWGGIPLNIGDLDSGLCLITENVDGWCDSPPLSGNDQARAIADGSMWGPKILGARVITITGVVIGPRDQLGAVRDLLVAQACDRNPADLSITDASGEGGQTLTASVRAGSDQLKITWLGSLAFRYQVVLTADDPALYGDWQQVTIAPGSGVNTGRVYQRLYSWQYAATSLPNIATMVNLGNWPAPVLALYQGDLSTPILTDDYGNVIRVDNLTAGATIQVDTGSLTAIADGGLSRASYVLPGSVPMLVPPSTNEHWYLATTGGGSVTLSWRSAWV